MADKLPIALIGYGRMGRMLHEMAGDFGCEVVAVIDPNDESTASAITAQSVGDARVCVDFSLPAAVVDNVRAVAGLGLPLALGVTGWAEHEETVRDIVLGSDTGLVYGANFSVGMNAFYAIVDAAAELMNHLPGYDAYGVELHHRRKIDSPSGTAHALSGILLDRLDRKQRLQQETVHRAIEDDELHFASVRAGSIPGTHLVGFDSVADTIELRHTARNRSGLAAGALLAARWIADRKGVYDFRDVFFEVISEQ